MRQEAIRRDGSTPLPPYEVALDSASRLLSVRVAHADAAEAARLANLVARAAESVGRAEANAALRRGRTAYEEREKTLGRRLRELAESERELLDRLRARVGAEDAELRAAELMNVERQLDTHLQEIRQRRAMKALRAAAVADDRAVLAHLRAADLPADLPSHRFRPVATPRSSALEGEMETLRALRARSSDPEDLRRIDAQILEAEASLARERARARAADLADQEIALRAEMEDLDGEIPLLSEALRETRSRLGPETEDVLTRLAESRTEQTAIDRQRRDMRDFLMQTELLEVDGYLRLVEEASAETAQVRRPRPEVAWPLAVLAGLFVALAAAVLVDRLRRSA